MRILLLICLVGVGCQNNSGSSPTPESKNSGAKSGPDDQAPAAKVEATAKKNDPTTEPSPEKLQAQIAQAMLECDAWEKAIKAFKLANNGVQPKQLKDAASYVKDGKDKLLSPWGTPYLMESDPKDLLSDDVRVTTTTPDHRLITKHGVEKGSALKQSSSEKEKARIDRAMKECDVWEKAVKAFAAIQMGAYPVSLEDAAKYIEGGKDKLLSPWATPYVMELNPKTDPPVAMRVITLTDDNQVVTKNGLESKK